MAQKIISLSMATSVKQTIQCLIIAKDQTTERKQKFLALAKDTSDEITICFEIGLYKSVKVGCVYQITGFVKKNSTTLPMTKYILFTWPAVKILEIFSARIVSEYLKLPKEIETIQYLTTSEQTRNLNTDLIVNLKCKLLNIVRRDMVILMTIQIDDMSYTVRITHIKDLSHLKNAKNKFITIKRVRTYMRPGQVSVLFCSTMFSQIFESENKPQNFQDSVETISRETITEILNQGIVNKRYKKICKVLYMRFTSFFNLCCKCFTKFANYNPTDDGYENDVEVSCGSCSYPIEKNFYVINIELTVVDAADINYETPFTITFFEHITPKILQNTGSNIKTYLSTYSPEQVEKYLKHKVINNLYEFTIHLPYVRPNSDPIYKRFYGVDAKLIKSDNSETNLDEDIAQMQDDVIEGASPPEQAEMLIDAIGENITSDYNNSLADDNQNNHHEMPENLLELINEDSTDTLPSTSHRSSHQRRPRIINDTTPTTPPPSSPPPSSPPPQTNEHESSLSPSQFDDNGSPNYVPLDNADMDDESTDTEPEAYTTKRRASVEADDYSHNKRAR